jgi:hypothetical protein
MTRQRPDRDNSRVRPATTKMSGEGVGAAARRHGECGVDPRVASEALLACHQCAIERALARHIGYLSQLGSRRSRLHGITVTAARFGTQTRLPGRLVFWSPNTIAWHARILEPKYDCLACSYFGTQTRPSRKPQTGCHWRTCFARVWVPKH